MVDASFFLAGEGRRFSIEFVGHMLQINTCRGNDVLSVFFLRRNDTGSGYDFV